MTVTFRTARTAAEAPGIGGTLRALVTYYVGVAVADTGVLGAVSVPSRQVAGAFYKEF